MRRELQDLDQSDIGICIKSLAKKVLYQNRSCIARCGDRTETTCEGLCMRDYSPIKNGIAIQGILPRPADAARFDVAIVNNGDRLITIQCPVNQKIDQLLQEMSQFALTKSELRVASLKMRHISNRKISQALFISAATLKTHLNHIYKKLPLALREILRPGKS